MLPTTILPLTVSLWHHGDCNMTPPILCLLQSRTTPLLHAPLNLGRAARHVDGVVQGHHAVGHPAVTEAGEEVLPGV